MLSDERINQLAAECGLPLGVRDMHDTAFALLARAIEREATAEAVRIMRELIDAWESERDMQSPIDAIRNFVERMK